MDSKPTPLHRARKARGLTLEQVSRDTGINTGNLSRIERGRGTSPARAAVLAAYFAPDLTELEILYPERFHGQPANEGHADAA